MCLPGHRNKQILELRKNLIKCELFMLKVGREGGWCHWLRWVGGHMLMHWNQTLTYTQQKAVCEGSMCCQNEFVKIFFD